MSSDDTLYVDVRVDAFGGRPPRFEARITVCPGITVLFGPSGAGKSTCLLAIAGLLRPARGSVTLGSKVLFDAARAVNVAPNHRRVALVFQSLALFPHLTALENVAFGLPGRLTRRERWDRARGWLERMRVSHLSKCRPSIFSGGEAQRVALARALASEPRVLLLDEPFSAMDSSLRLELGNEVRSLVSELRIPAILVTHDRDDARRLGSGMLLLEEGRLVSEGPPSAFFRETETTMTG